MANRDENGQFAPGGGSANPGGRPKLVAEFQKALRERHYEKALTALEECLDDDDGRVRVAALREVFDRLFGKATQRIAGDDGGALRVDVDFVDVLKKLVVGG